MRPGHTQPNAGNIKRERAATAGKLADLEITNAAALAAMPMKQARGIGTVVLERLVAELNGVQAGAVETVEP